MRIAVEGCAHGELEVIYEALQEVEKSDGKKIDLLICCGDFQSTRNLTDLSCMAVPDKYKDMCSFYKYYTGEKVASVLTIFIGGNHEASNYLQELPYGGWVAPNIYYLGYAGVVLVADIRIAGVSGIYKGQDWMQGHHEVAPYNNSTIRSVYHVRNLEVFRLKQLSGTINIFLSHDWPRGITRYGDEEALLRNKPFFKNDVEGNALGSPPCMELLEHHYPSYWFSAHLHCKFAALVKKPEDSERVTKFLALDKCLPKRKFLQILEIPHDDKLPIKLSYDLEWLTILYLTNHLLSVKSGVHYMPGQGGNGRWMYTPSEAEKAGVSQKFADDFTIPTNFSQTTEAYDPQSPRGQIESARLSVNPQTTEFCEKLGIDDPCALLQIMNNTRENSFNNSITDKSSDSRDVSFTIDEDNAISSTLEEDSPENSSDILSQTNLAVENDVLDDALPEKLDLLIREEERKETNEASIESIDEKLRSTNDEVESVQTEPNCKKFKRRNHSFYANTT